MKKDQKKLYWSRFARTYDADMEYVVGKPVLQALEERLLKEQHLGELIEFGCGSGFFTKTIAVIAKKVIATDISEGMVGIAQKRLGKLENVMIEQADCGNTIYPGGRFDSVFMANLLHVIRNPVRCLKESYRILRNQGSLLVIDFTVQGMSWFERAKLGIKYLQRWGMLPSGGRSLSSENLVRLVGETGFEIGGVELIEAGSSALYLMGRKVQK